MKKALIFFGGWEGHQPKETSLLFADELSKRGFEVTTYDTLATLENAKSLLAFDLIVPNWTMGSFSGDQEKNLLAAIEAGTGLGGFHGGMGDAFRQNTSYQFMVGGQFVAHPDDGTRYVVKIVKPEDPIVAGIKDFSVQSEQYYMHVDPANEVLATTEFQTRSAPWVNGTIMPVIWKRHFGKGRVFYSSLGHNAKVFDQPEVREITIRGLTWAAR